MTSMLMWGLNHCLSDVSGLHISSTLWSGSATTILSINVMRNKSGSIILLTPYCPIVSGSASPTIAFQYIPQPICIDSFATTEPLSPWGDTCLQKPWNVSAQLMTTEKQSTVSTSNSAIVLALSTDATNRHKGILDTAFTRVQQDRVFLPDTEET